MSSAGDSLVGIGRSIKESQRAGRIVSRYKDGHTLGEAEGFIYGVGPERRFDTGRAQTGSYDFRLEWLDPCHLDEFGAVWLGWSMIARHMSILPF
jgi:hypothetical protein